MAFKKGHPKYPGTGGKREGSGRKPDWLREKCQKLIEKNNLLDFLCNVATGTSYHQPGGEDSYFGPAPVRDRIRATEMLIDRAYGKVPVPIAGQDKDGNIVPVIVNVVDYGRNNHSA